MQKNLCKSLNQCFFFFDKSLSSWDNSTRPPHPFFVNRVGSLARNRGLIYGENENSCQARVQTEPLRLPRFPAGILSSVVQTLCGSVCLIAAGAFALQFSVAPLMLFSKSSQSSRTNWEGKQSFHMKRGQKIQVEVPAELLPSKAVTT